MVALVGWVHRHRQTITGYVIAENRFFKRQPQGRRFRPSYNDRRRLTAKAKVHVRSALDEIASLLTPDTLRAWHGHLIARMEFFD